MKLATSVRGRYTEAEIVELMAPLMQEMLRLGEQFRGKCLELEIEPGFSAAIIHDGVNPVYAVIGPTKWVQTNYTEE